MEMGNLIVKQQEMFEVSCQKNYNSSEGILRVNMEEAENHIFKSIRDRQYCIGGIRIVTKY